MVCTATTRGRRKAVCAGTDVGQTSAGMSSGEQKAVRRVP